jgi:hypothetical protein
MKNNKEHLAHFNIAGLTYYDALECYDQLCIGTKLTLMLDPENKYDPRAVAIYYENYHLGYVPRSENRLFFKLLKMGYQDAIVVRIQQRDKSTHPEQQFMVVAHLLENK